MSSSKLDLIFKRNTIGGTGRVDIKTAKQEIKSLLYGICFEKDEPDSEVDQLRTYEEIKSAIEEL